MATVKDLVEGDTEIDHNSFLEELQEADSEFGFMREIVESGENSGELSGVPFVVKDAICAEGAVTSAGSRIIEDYRPVFDSTVVSRLREAGATFYGKTQQDEFGFGSFSLNCGFGTPENPHDPDRVAGGSSGGAAAVVAAMDRPVISVGESTGGSITNPAAYCGVVGITPTYGRVSRYGLVSYANSLDKIGVLADTVYGAAKGLEVIAGPDGRDQTTVEREAPSYAGNLEPVSDLKIGIPEQYVELEGLESGVHDNFQDSLDELRGEGATVEKVDMPLLAPDYALPAYYVLAMAEASTNLAKFSGMRYGLEHDPEDFEDFNSYFSEVRSEGFGEEAKRRILVGTYTRMAGYRHQYYVKAAEVRQKIIDQFREVFQEYDVLASPSMPNIAPKISEAESLSPVETYAMDSLTVAPNLAGMPTVSVPNGESQGMPTGLRFIGNQFEEQQVLDAAYTHQS